MFRSFCPFVGTDIFPFTKEVPFGLDYIKHIALTVYVDSNKDTVYLTQLYSRPDYFKAVFKTKKTSCVFQTTSGLSIRSTDQVSMSGVLQLFNMPQATLTWTGALPIDPHCVQYVHKDTSAIVTINNKEYNVKNQILYLKFTDYVTVSETDITKMSFLSSLYSILNNRIANIKTINGKEKERLIIQSATQDIQIKGPLANTPVATIYIKSAESFPTCGA